MSLGVAGAIGRLLSRLGLGVPDGAEPKSQTQAMTEGGADHHPARGTALDAEGILLAGMGFGEADRHTGRRNVSEKASLAEFLAGAQEPELPGHRRGSEAEADAEREDAGPGPSAEARDEARAQPRARAEEPVREEAQLREGTEAESREAPGEIEGEATPERRQDDDDDEHRPGAGWWAEEPEERDGRKKGDGGDAEVLTHEHRCRARTPDGQRCLHRAVEGQPYCRVHRGRLDA